MKITLKNFGLLLIAIIMVSCNDSADVIEYKESCLPSSLQNGVIAFYPFSNGSINDFSANNYHLTNTTSASSGIDRNGNINCAFHFNASNGDFLSYNNPTFLDDFQTLPFSISLWYKNETSTAGNYELLIGRDENINACNHGQWSIGLYDYRKPIFGINDHYLWWNINSNVEIQEWRHLVITSLNNDLKMYLNGAISSESITNCNSNTASMNIGDLLIGKDFTGLLDDIIIYDKILTQSEITELYSLTPCCQ